jgi:hypothetical protein
MLRIRIKKLEEGGAEAKAEPLPGAAPCTVQQRPAVVQLPPTQVCTHANISKYLPFKVAKILRTVKGRCRKNPRVFAVVLIGSLNPPPPPPPSAHIETMTSHSLYLALSTPCVEIFSPILC